MARSRAGADDQKQVLTITLVLFVLLSIILGVVAYFGYAEQGELQTQIKASKAVAKRAGDERDAAKVAMTALKEMIGANLATKEEQQQFEGLRNITKEKGADGKDRLVFDSTTGPHKDFGIVWDPTQKLPGTTYMDRINKLQKDMKKVDEAQDQLEAQAKKNEQQYQQNVAALKKANEDMKKALDETSVVIGKKFTDIDARYNEQIDKLVKAMPNFEALEKKLNELTAERDKALGQVKNLIAKAEADRKKFEEKIPQIDIIAYDQPKGQITRLDRTGRTAYLNLGSADFAKPGLTFSVFSPGQYKANAERKGSVEIVQILDKHLSMAKVTEPDPASGNPKDIQKAARDPLLSNDLLYNPTWTPGLREHVAIAGFIDLVGDGRDATPELVRMLEKQGVIVDAWLDLRDMSLKGANKDKEEKITRQTSYLIMGAQPDLDSVVAKEGDRRQEGKLNINAEISKMHEKAKERSVTIVTARRFLALMGMKIPKQTKDTDWTHYLLRQPKEGAGGDMPAKKEGGEKEMPKKKMEKKEEEK